MADNLQRVIELAKAGQKEEARKLATAILKQDPSNARAWIAMAQLVDDRQKAIDCLRQVIRLTEDVKMRNWATGQLEKLTAAAAPQPAPPPPVQVASQPDRGWTEVPAHEIKQPAGGPATGEALSFLQRTRATTFGRVALIGGALFALCLVCTICGTVSNAFDMLAGAEPSPTAPPIPTSKPTLPPPEQPSSTVISPTDIPLPAATDLLPAETLIPTMTSMPPTVTALPPTATSIPITFTIVSLTSPIERGKQAALKIQTTPATTGASCHLKYILPSGDNSSAQGLGGVLADANGICSWAWIIGASTNPGSGTLVITVEGYTERHEIIVLE